MEGENVVKEVGDGNVRETGRIVGEVVGVHCCDGPSQGSKGISNSLIGHCRRLGFACGETSEALGAELFAAVGAKGTFVRNG